MDLRAEPVQQIVKEKKISSCNGLNRKRLLIYPTHQPKSKINGNTDVMVWVEAKYIAVSDGIHELALSSHDGLLRHDFASRCHNVQFI